MKISYNWLKLYVPEAPAPEKLTDIFNYHLCEVESITPLPSGEGAGGEGDWIFDLKILPNRAHDLLSYQGVARELASLLNIKYVDSTPKYKIPESKPTKLKIEIKTKNCRRYMGRIVRNVKIGSSPSWAVKHLESIGQRSINNLVDAANILMYDSGQPAHVFDLDKLTGGLIIRQAKKGEKITTLDNHNLELNETDMVVADFKISLGLAGIKGGKVAEVDMNTRNIIIEIANFDPIITRKSAQRANIFTDARKRFENDLSPELAPYAMRELSALIAEMCPEAIFEDIVDVYPEKQKERKLSFSAEKISKVLGLKVSDKEVEDILKRYNFFYDLVVGVPSDTPTTKFTITVPPMRLDLVIEEDMAEEIGRILGYDKVKPQIPRMSDIWEPKVNETRAKIIFARNRLLADGYFEVMTYTFCNSGEVEVQNSASDKKFLRTNLTDGLKESIKLNLTNSPLLGLQEIKIFEIGTIFKKNGEEIHVAYGDKKGVKETTLEKFVSPPRSDQGRSTPPQQGGEGFSPRLDKEGVRGGNFKMWSLFPFIARDIAVFVPENVKSSEVSKIIKENMGDMVIKGPELFDEFKKPASPESGETKISYAFRLVFQSYDRTLTDAEVNEIMVKIADKIKTKGWQVR